MPPTKKVGIDIGIRAGDLSGLKAVDGLTDGLARAKAEIAEIKANGGIGGVAVGADDLAVAEAKVASISDQLQRTQDALIATQAEFDRLGASGGAGADAASAKIVQLKGQIASLNQQAAQAVGGLGQVDTGGAGIRGLGALRPLGSLAMVSGNVQAAGLIQVVDDLGRLSEKLPDFRKQIGALHEAFTAGGEGAEGFFGKLVGGAEGLTAAIGPFVVGLGVGLVALAALTVLQGQINAQQEEQLRLNKEEMAALDDEIVRRRTITALVKSGNTEAAQAAIDDAQAKLEDAQAHQAGLVAQQTEVARKYADLGASLDPITRQQLGEQGAGLAEAIAAYVKGTVEPAQAAVDGLTAAFPDVQKTHAQIQAANDQVTALEQAAQFQVEVAQLLATGSAADVAQKREALRVEKESLETMLPTLEKLAGKSADADAALKQVQARLGAIAGEQGQLGQVAPLVQGRDDTAARQQAALAGLDAGIQARTQLYQLERTASEDQVTQRLNAIADEKRAINELLPQFQAQAALTKDGADKLAAYQQQLRKLGDEADHLLADVEPLARLRQLGDGLKELGTALDDADAKVADIRVQEGKKLAELETTRTKAEAKAYADRGATLLKITGETSKAIDAANADYMRSQATAYADFATAQTRADSDAQTTRLRALQDLASQLQDYELKNDVVGFLAAKKAGDTAMLRAQQDASTTDQRSTADFQTTQARAEAAHQVQLDQIAEQAQAQRDAAQATYDQQTALAEQQQTDAVALARQQADAQVQAVDDAENKQIAAIRLKYSISTATEAAYFKSRSVQIAVDQQHLDDALDAVTAHQLDALTVVAHSEIDLTRQIAQARQRAEIELAQTVVRYVQGSWINAANSIGTSILSLITQTSAAVRAASVTPAGQANIGMSGLYRPTAFGKGGLVKAGQQVFGYFEPSRTYDEAVVPLERSTLQDLFAGLNLGGPTVQIGDVSVGDGVTRAEVKDALTALAASIARGISKARGTG